LNCGYGSGYSVREVLDTVLELSERKFPVIDEPRRAGDPPKLIARADNIREVLGWTPKMNDLHTIVKTSIDWEKKLAGA
jgi:UDP-glucose 4-epimerase